MGKIGVLAWPAFSTKEGNPYNYILYNNIRSKGCEVYEFNFSLKNVLKYSLSSNYQIFHIHWPTHVFFGKSEVKARLRLKILFLFINLIKSSGRKVVWTVHNLEAHESKFPGLQKQLDSFLYRKVDGFISLNESGLDLIRKKANSLERQDFAHIFHPHYEGYYLNTVSRQKARQNLGVPASHFVFLFLGQIRTYKNVVGLVEAYKKIKGATTTLMIAGNVHPEVEAELRASLGNADSIVFTDSFVKDEDLQLYFHCADVVVTPYDKIFNSGSVFLNLSFGKPTLAPAIHSFTELKQLVGNRWIKTYQGQITAEELENSMAEVLSESYDVPALMPDISYFDPEKVAQETIAFFDALLPQKEVKTTFAEKKQVVHYHA